MKDHVQDVRWQQRYQNYRKALASLTKGVELARSRPLSELEEQGLIQAFEFTHELAWNLLKDYLEYQGIVGIIGSRDATRKAFQNDLIADGETWMKMIKARNLTSHTYEPLLAASVARDTREQFYPLFAALDDTFARILAEAGIHGN